MPGNPTARDEQGFGLIEMVITVAVISIAFVAVLSAIGVMITTGAQHRQLTRTEAAIRNAAESVKKPATYVDCPSPGTYTVTSSLPSGYTAAVTNVQVINDATSSNPTYSSATCPGSDPGVQLVTIAVCPHTPSPCTATSSDAQTIQVVKRRSIS